MSHEIPGALWGEAGQALLSEYPLYRKIPLQIPADLSELAALRPQLRCLKCNGERTYFIAQIDAVEIQNVVRWKTFELHLPPGIRELCYGCSKCQSPIHFTIKFETMAAWKVGQWPAWSIAVTPTMASFLGEELSDLYARGKICESQGYGIGAFGYYRRIVEHIVDRLLDAIAENIEEAKTEEFSVALRAARRETVAQDKIALVKDMLPESLRPDGLNPLDILHGSLSAGLHQGSEEECLEEGIAVRNALEYLIAQLALRRAGRKAFTDSMRKLLERRSKGIPK